MRDHFMKFYNYYGKIQMGFAAFAGVATFCIMLLIVANALLRKTINIPIPAALEVTQALLVLVIVLPFAYTQMRHEHVNTIFFTKSLPRRSQRFLHIFWLLCGAALFLAVTYGTFQYGMRSYRINEQVWGATIQFPVWPSKLAVSLGTLLFSIQLLLDAVRAILFGEEVDGAMESQAHV